MKANNFVPETYNVVLTDGSLAEVEVTGPEMARVKSCEVDLTQISDADRRLLYSRAVAIWSRNQVAQQDPSKAIRKLFRVQGSNYDA